MLQSKVTRQRKQKECLAVLLGMKEFSTYLIGKLFVLQTDIYPCTGLASFNARYKCSSNKMEFSITTI